MKVVGIDGKTILFEKNIVASASEAQESGGVKRAQNGEQFAAYAESDGNWTVLVDLKSGDEVTVDVYRNLSVIKNLVPGLAILGFIVGLVLFLRSNAESSGKK